MLCITCIFIWKFDIVVFISFCFKEILNDISNKSKNVLLGCAYIPPEFFPYSSDEAFLQLEDELITHSNFSKNVALIMLWVFKRPHLLQHSNKRLPYLLTLPLSQLYLCKGILFFSNIR
jgi:hypothetical protein